MSINREDLFANEDLLRLAELVPEERAPEEGVGALKDRLLIGEVRVGRVGAKGFAHDHAVTKALILSYSVEPAEVSRRMLFSV